MLHSPEAESLFNTVLGKFLDEVENVDRGAVVDYACRVCGSRYRSTWYEYGAFAQGYNYDVFELEVEDEGARLKPPMPFLRFRTGYQMRDQSRFLEVEDVEQVLKYLAD